MRGLANDGQNISRVGDARHADDDVFALKVDFGAGDTESIHAIGKNRHDLLQVCGRGVRRWFVDDRKSAGQVQTQLRTPTERQRRRQ